MSDAANDYIEPGPSEKPRPPERQTYQPPFTPKPEVGDPPSPNDGSVDWDMEKARRLLPPGTTFLPPVEGSGASASRAMGIAPSTAFDPNVWAAKHGIAIGLDPKGNLVPLKKGGGFDYAAPGYRYSETSTMPDAEPQVHGEPSAPQIRPIGAPKVGLVDPSNPLGLPPEAATVVGVIRSAEGTAKNPHVLFGGREYDPGPVHPAKEGWQGSTTAYGPTHAADAGQWQPGSWDDEVKRAKAAGIDLKFNEPAHQDWAIWDRASRIYHNATGRDLAGDVKAGKADYRALGAEWQGLASGQGSPSLRGWGTGTSPALRAHADALQAEATSLQDRYHTDAAELMRQANAAPAGSRARDEAIAKLREREHDYLSKYEAIASQPPVMKPVDALENFGSAATIIALLGGLFSRRHLTAALGAAGQAMQGINQNNYDQFQRAYKTWEQQSTTALNMVKLHNEEIRALIDDKKMAEDEKNARLRVLFEGLGMSRQADQMALGVHEKIFAEFVGLERAAQTASQQALLVKQSVNEMLKAKYKAEGASDEDATLRAGRESGMLPAGSAPTGAKAQEQEVQDEIKRQMDAYTKAHPGASADELAEARRKTQLAVRQEQAIATSRSATGTISDEQADLLADQYIQGNYAVITALPRSGPSRVKVENRVAEKLRGQPDAARQITMNRLRMVEAEAAARTAGRVTMNTELFATEAAGAGAQVVETSKLFPRTNIPKVNEALRAFETNTGDPNIIRFGVALNALVNAYGKMSNPTGTGIHDADKDRITRILDTSLSQGQVEAGVQQVITEGRVMSTAAHDAQQRVLGAIAPVAPGQTAPSQSAPSAPTAAPAGGEVIQNGWRYDATTHQPLGPAQ